MTKRPLILISNDDGVDAQGIQVLTKLMQWLGDVIVVAPNGPRSAASCSISPMPYGSMNALSPIRVKLVGRRKSLRLQK